MGGQGERKRGKVHKRQPPRRVADEETVFVHNSAEVQGRRSSRLIERGGRGGDIVLCPRRFSLDLSERRSLSPRDTFSGSE